MKLFKIYSLIVVFFFSLSLFNIAHAVEKPSDCYISDKSALKGKYLTGCNLQDADLRGANLSGATWISGRKCAKKSVGECL